MNTKANSPTTLKKLLSVTMALLATSAVSTALPLSNYEPYSFGTLAGMTPGTGDFGADGTGSAARFYYPSAVAVDSAGNVYVADTSNNTIRKITPSRVVSTLAGLAGSIGSDNGTGCAARFTGPSGVAVDNAGNVYVADTFNHTIRKITPSGVVTTFAGVAGRMGSADGTGSAARFKLPRDVAVDSAGNVYVADSGNQTIRKITPSRAVSTFAGLVGTIGTADGTGTEARFWFPRGLAVDSAGNVYVADTNNDTIRMITPSAVVTTIAGSPRDSGSVNGTRNAARFDHPRGVTVDSAGNVYVADYDNHTIRKITPSGVVSTFAGLAGSYGSGNGTGNAARFYFPEDVAVDNAGNVYVADSFNFTIRKITPSRLVSTFAGLAHTSSANGTGSAARFNLPNGAAVDSAGNVYVGDTYNHTIRKITPSGMVSTFAGLAGSYGSANGTGSAARFYFPHGVAVDGAGNVYVADTNNDTIRKITPSGVVSTFAGFPGRIGHDDGTGAAASFHLPQGVAVDDSGNVFVADTVNHTIRKITPSRVVSTIAGSHGHSGFANGTGTDALFNLPSDVAVDTAGNVYVADTNNDMIRKIAPSGVVSTFAGFPGRIGSSDGTGGTAAFNVPQGVAADSTGNVYVADSGNHTIRKITPSRVVSTLAGLAGSNGSDDGAGSDARFYFPHGVAVDNSGKVYVADTFNDTVRVGIQAPPIITTVGQLFVYQLETTGTTSYTVSNLPPGLSPDTGLSAILGNPTATGTFQVVISATYPAITTNSTLTIMVQPVPGSGPTITSGTSVTSKVGEQFSFQVYTHTANGSPPVTVTATGLPTGLSVDPATGFISGSATASGSSLVTLTASDGTDTTTATLQLTFTNDRVVPVITSPSTAFVYPDQLFSYTITAPTPCNGEVAFDVGGQQLLQQHGLMFNAQTATISGIYMNEGPRGKADERNSDSEERLVDGEDLISPDRTIRPPLIVCQPFATHRNGGMDQPFTTNGETATIPLNLFFGGPTTNPATNVASSSATLNGSLQLDGVTTTVYFQYGLTTNYGLMTAPHSHSGNTYQNIHADVSNLTPNTVYHFQIVAHNMRGTSYGDDVTFTTLSADRPSGRHD